MIERGCSFVLLQAGLAMPNSSSTTVGAYSNISMYDNNL